MLASLTIHRWLATLTDKKVTREVAEANNVEQKRAGRYRKYAINVEAPSYKAVVSAASALRDRHYDLTLPWGQDGARILTAVGFMQYADEIRKLTAAYYAAVEAFVADYPKLCEDAKVELGPMYNAKDYPLDIRKHFGVESHKMPMPAATDFRVQLGQDLVEQIQRDIAEQLAETTREAMREPYQRLFDHIARMVERLTDPKGVFRDSLVTGLADLCSILPALNLTGDPQLEALRVKAEQLCVYSPQQLRESTLARGVVAMQAAEIQSQMAAYMGAA